MRSTSRQGATLSTSAYLALKELILSEQLAPGSFLSERQIAERLGMSKTPVRLAIERLSMEGLLTVSPQQGVLVTVPSVEEIRDLFELRRLLEGYTVRKLAGRLSPGQIQVLHDDLKAQEEAVEAGDVWGYRQLDTQFHLRLAEFLNNQEIRRIMEQLSDRLMRIIFRIVNRQPSRMRPSTEEHRGILEAIMEGDGEAAEERMAQHLEWGRQFLMTWDAHHGQG